MEHLPAERGDDQGDDGDVEGEEPGTGPSAHVPFLTRAVPPGIQLRSVCPSGRASVKTERLCPFNLCLFNVTES